MNSNNIIAKIDGYNTVLINNVRFKSRRNIKWKEIENYLKVYVGNSAKVNETLEMIHIGIDFPDEFCHSKDKIRLKGANEKAKANMVLIINELIQIAANKRVSGDFNHKHKAKAKNGWYKYDVRFGLPVYDTDGTIQRYNIFSSTMLVRCNADGKLYLYDFVRTKKETSSPLKQ